MNKITECSIIIKDDFNNIFLVRRKTKKNQPILWYTVGRKLKGRETEEKCIARAVKDDLKSIVFNIEKIGETIIDETLGEASSVYIGELKEKVVYGNDIAEGKWVSLKEVNNYDLADGEKEKISLYVNKY
ncbi:NUDIX domain-containing protein [Clostridium nigeriense]|uniref:NUDIX domain-containing protein n=1 Tax=Clostridium nigeriense TaxID=1805470 RepID=UPI0008320C38|nr:NUDIX domain-containing protein [Clostridium nigeriense]